VELSDRTDVERALRIVHLTPQALRELGGTVLNAGRAYLVGSLAGGLGNRGSDVDIHVLTADTDEPGPPFLFFSGATPVDVEHYPATLPGRLVCELAGAPVVELPVGTVSVGALIGQDSRRVLSRWLNALALRPEDPPVFTDAEKVRLLPAVVRASLDQLLLIWACARLASPSGTASGYLWARAGRELLELRCRARGDVVTSEKWLPRRALRAGFGRTSMRAHYAAAGETDLRTLLADTGLAGLDPWQIATVSPAPELRAVKLGSDTRVLNRHGRLLADVVTSVGTIAEVVDAVPAARLLRALRDGELVAKVGTESLIGALNG
jgi:hypothetical protein